MDARAAVADGEGGLAVVDIEVGPPGPGEVLVELHASGVCHTDFDGLHGGFAGILGHEGAGVVREVGDGVTSAARGDRVVLNWAMPCGACVACRAGRENLCERQSPVLTGFGGPGHAHAGATTREGRPVVRLFNLGTLSTATVVRQEAVTPIPQGVPFPAASIAGCGVMTGFGSVMNAAAVPAGSSVVVIGCGGVGLNVVQAARIAGASPIIAVDLHERRLDVARRFGATDVVVADRADTGLLDAVGRVHAMTSGRGADFAFECTAVPALGAAPLAMVRHGGMAVQVSGIEQDLTIDMRLFEWDKTYLNPLYGQCRPSQDFPRLFELYLAGELLLDELVTTTYALDDVAAAFDDLVAGVNAKGVVLLADG
jgi:Zn-dependent alcohol dehydrogenase